LETIPIVPFRGSCTRLNIPLAGISFSNSSRSFSEALTKFDVFLDSGSSLTHLPYSLTRKIYDAVGVRYSVSGRHAFVDCALAAAPETLDFRFTARKTIRVGVVLSRPVTNPSPRVF
jgi:hypothetical protein